MSKRIRKIILGVSSALLLICLVLACTFIGLRSGKKTSGSDDFIAADSSHHASATAIKPANYDKEFILDGTSCADQATKWNEAADYAIANSTKTVKVTLKKDWTGVNGVFGSGSGFSNGAAVNGYSTHSGAIMVPANTKMILDLNGCTINAAMSAMPSGINGGAIVVLGDFELRDDSFAYGSDGYEKGRITGGKAPNGGAIAQIGGKFTLSGGTIINNQGKYGGGIATFDGKFTMNGGCIVNNVAEGFGGGIQLGSPAIINGGIIKGNSSTATSGNAGNACYGGGAICLYEYSVDVKLTINDCLIENNTAGFVGGAINLTPGTELIIKGGTYRSNSLSTGGQGGVIWNSLSEITISGGLFEGNNGANSGGVITTLCAYASTTTIEGGIFRNNKATAGSVYFGCYNLTVSGGLFTGNEASATAPNASTSCTGAFYLYSVAAYRSVAAFSNCTIVNNTNGGITTSGYTSLSMEGSVVVTDNTLYNCYLYKSDVNSSAVNTGVDPLINVTGSLAGSWIGITIGQGVFATNLASNVSARVTLGGSFTTVYGTSGEVRPKSFFFSDNPNYMMGEASWEGSLSYKTSSTSWSYGTMNWSYTKNGTTETASGNTIDCEYGDVISDVTASYNDGTTTHSWKWNSGVFSSTGSAGSSKFKLTDGEGNSVSNITNAGTYTFKVLGDDPIVQTVYAMQFSLAFNIKPKEISVNLLDTSSNYTESETLDCSPKDVNGESLGITLKREDYSDLVGKYRVTGTCTNKNFNVTFVGSSGSMAYSIHEIKPLEVTVIINKTESEYGSEELQISQDLNNTPDAKGKYNGGWRYESGSKEFISADLDKTKKIYPFKLSSTVEYTKAQSSAAGFTFPAVGTVNTITTSELNPNYTITFKRDGDTTGTLTTGEVEITKAKIVVKPDTTHGNKTVYKLADVGSGKTIEIPAANIELKGGQSVSGIEYTGQVFDSKDKTSTAPAKLPVLDETDGSPTQGKYIWQDGTYSNTALANTPINSWVSTSGAAALTKKAAGTYKVIFKISAPNHEDLVVDWTLSISSETVTVSLITEKDVSGTWTKLTTNPVYGDKVRVEIDKSALAATVDQSKLTNYKIYYIGSGTTVYGAWDSATDVESPAGSGVTSDGSKHKTYGTTTAPTKAGTYSATLVPSDGDYDLGSPKSLALTIEKQKITKAPKDNNVGAAKVYSGADQTFTIADFDFDSMKLGTLPTGISEKGNSFTNKTALSRQLEAKNAGEYVVKFALKDADNYEWDSSITVNASKEYELKLEIKKTALDVTFTAPAASETDWLWEPGDYSAGSYITYAITPSSIKNSEAVTVKLKWCKKPASGSAATFDTTTNIDQDGSGNDRLDISSFGKGEYVVAAYLPDDSAAADVNKNYEIKEDATSKIPTTCKQAFEVSDGTASVKNIGWKIEYTLNGKQESIPLSGAKLKYMLNSDGTAVEYTLVVDATTLPDYIEVYASYGVDKGVSGYDSTGYKDGKQTNATTTKYKTYVALKIKDQDTNGNPYDIVFDLNDTTMAGYVKQDEKYCELYTEWTIAKGTVDTSKVEWGYTVAGDVDGNGKPVVHDFRVVQKLDGNGAPIPVYERDEQGNIKLDSSNNKIQATDESGNPLWETIYETDARGLSNITPVVKTTGLPDSVLTVGGYNGSGTSATNTVNKAQIGSTLTSSATFTLADAANFELPNPVQLEWRVTKQTIKLGGWNDNGKVTVDGKTYTSPVVTSGDTSVMSDDDIAKLVEYVYEYNGKTYTIKELWDLADQDLANGNAGRLQNVKITVKAKDGYQLDASQTSLFTNTTTIGYTGTPITVTADTKTGEYGKAAISIKLEAAGLGDVTGEQGLYELKVYDKDGKELGLLGSDKATLSKLNAGKYTIKVEMLQSGYNVKAGQETIEFTITAIELELPVLSKNPVFNGTEITVGDLLDENTLEYLKSGLIELSGEGAEGSGFRDVADENGVVYTHTLVISIKDSVNYKWKGVNGATVKPTKLTLTEETKPETTKISDSEANIAWEIQPLELSVANADWSLNGKGGPKLSLKGVPNGTEYALEYKYYSDKNGGEELTEVKEGNAAWVSAILTGADVNKGNIRFADAVDGTGGLELAARQSHTTPKSGAAAFFGSAMSFLKAHWLWFLIGLLALIFLIVLICIIAHRRKTKEIREEKKAQKEEEKRRKEQEREEEKRRKEQERELEKAKAEAELAKMRAGLGLGAGAAGMAMAAQQQPQQQMQPQMQPMMQQMPMQPQMQQYPQYPQYPQYLQQMPQQQYGDPVMMNELARLKAENEMRLKTELERARAETERAKAEAEIARRGGMPQYFNAQGLKDGEQGSIPMDVLGALVVSALKNMAGNGNVPKLEEPKPVLTESTSPTSVETPTVYPPDAVITTTTTVDTTKSKPAEPISRDSDRDRNFDIDGFYDTFESNENK